MGVSKESISKFLIRNRFHVKLRILSPENCKQSLRVKSWKAEVTAEKKQPKLTNQNFYAKQQTKTFKLNQSLTCADFGIYVATCVICHEQYVGHTSNKFSKRWSAHRSNWNKQDCKTDSDKDQMALSRHYSENHGTINKPPLHYKQATTARSIHRYFCRTTKLSLSGYLWK